jgi:hypothetical protein
VSSLVCNSKQSIITLTQSRFMILFLNFWDSISEISWTEFLPQQNGVSFLSSEISGLQFLKFLELNFSISPQSQNLLKSCRDGIFCQLLFFSWGQGGDEFLNLFSSQTTLC